MIMKTEVIITNIKHLLRKLTKTGFFHIFGSSVLNKILSFMCSIVVVRIVSKISFGEYTYANNIVSLILLFSGLGMVSGTFQLCSEEVNNKIKQEEIYRYGCSIGSFFNLFLAILILIISLIVKFKIEGANVLIRLMAFYPLIMILFEFQQVYLRSTLENRKYSYSTTINTVLIVVFSILGSVLFEVKGLIFGTYLAYILSVLILSMHFRVPILLKKKKLDATVKKLLYRISIVSMCNNGLSQLLYLVDIFIMGIILPNESIIASYKIATVIPTAMAFIPSAIVTYIYPYFAMNRDDKEWTYQHYILLLKSMLIINICISLLLIIFSSKLISLIYGDVYLDAVPCFRVLVISYLFSGTFRIISGNLLVTQRKVEFNLFVAIISGIINIIGNLILIPKYGSMGAAIVTLIVVVVSSLFSTTYYIKLIK